MVEEDDNHEDAREEEVREERETPRKKLIYSKEEKD